MKKRFLSILAALCLCLSLLSATVLADSSVERVPVNVSTWTELQATIDGNNDAILTSNIAWKNGSIVIPKGKTVTIDLNGHSIDADSKGTVVKVYGTLTLKNSGSDHPTAPGAGPSSGLLMNGTSGDKGGAGGIYIASDGKLIMNGGWIYNCTSTHSSDGAGGVYVSEGATFEMSAGVIYQCKGHPSNGITATASGVVNRGTFTMTGPSWLRSGNANFSSNSDMKDFPVTIILKAKATASAIKRSCLPKSQRKRATQI